MKRDTHKNRKVINEDNLIGRIDVTAAWKKLCFILSDRSDFLMIKSQLHSLEQEAEGIDLHVNTDKIE